MKKTHFGIALILISAGLAGCSGQYPGWFGGAQTAPGVSGEQRGLAATSVDREGRESKVNITMTGGGEVGMHSMDGDDKRKMMRALDAGTGKSTHWENAATGVGYTVTPIRKITIQGNPFCREYSVQASRGSNSRTVNGRACVTTDGAWHSI